MRYLWEVAGGACAPPNNLGLEVALLSRAPPISKAQRGRAPPIFSSEHPKYLDHNYLPGWDISATYVASYISSYLYNSLSLILNIPKWSIYHFSNYNIHSYQQNRANVQDRSQYHL